MFGAGKVRGFAFQGIAARRDCQINAMPRAKQSPGDIDEILSRCRRLPSHRRAQQFARVFFERAVMGRCMLLQAGVQSIVNVPDQQAGQRLVSGL